MEEDILDQLWWLLPERWITPPTRKSHVFAKASHLGRIYYEFDAIPSKLPSSKEYLDAYIVGPVYRKNTLHYLSVFIQVKNHESSS